MRSRIAGAALVLVAALAVAGERDEKVKQDRADFRARDGWIYNDLDKGIAAAKRANKPLMVVIRCIP